MSWSSNCKYEVSHASKKQFETRDGKELDLDRVLVDPDAYLNQIQSRIRRSKILRYESRLIYYLLV